MRMNENISDPFLFYEALLAQRHSVSGDVDKNKAAIILLSTAANIISRHTSMVGVDKERPDKVIGDMMQRRVPMMREPTSRALNMKCMRMSRSAMPVPLGEASDSIL